MERRLDVDNVSVLVHGDTKTYVFNVESPPDEAVDKPKRSKLLQIIPSLCACLPSLIFGIMLGWPSPTFPNLLEENSEIPITWDQSALIAGYLMIGNLFGSTFSWIRPFGLKYGILIAIIPIIIGYLVMWHAFNVPCILASRFLIGFGNGYATPQVIEYINDTCENLIRIVVIKFAYFFLMIGVFLAYCIGPFLTFRTFSLSIFIFSIITMIVCAFIPHNPSDIDNIEIQNKSELNIVSMIKTRYYFKTLPVLLMLVFFQQFTGAPTTTVYSNIIFDKFGCQNPDLVAIVYVSFYFISVIFSSFYSHKFNTKYTLALTCFISSLLTFANAYLCYFYPQPSYAYIKSLIMIIYIFIHSLGIGFIPSVIATQFFEPNSLKSINRIQVGLYSICAIVSTKLFQVIITYHAFYLGFIYFASIGTVGTLYILIFIPAKNSI